MQFSSEQIRGGVMERAFSLEVDGEPVPGILWSPIDASGSRPLILLGHGGSQHKETPNLVTRARRYVKTFGYAVSAIDAPGHGARVSAEEAVRLASDVSYRIRNRVTLDGDFARELAVRSARAVPEWRATLDALRSLDDVGVGPVGYWGVSMGTLIGVPFVASDRRITAAVFGLAGLTAPDGALAAAARSVTIPVEFAQQWDDELVPRDAGLALFDALGSAEKTLHINPGGHLGIPAFELASWERFFSRHLVA